VAIILVIHTSRISKENDTRVRYIGFYEISLPYVILDKVIIMLMKEILLIICLEMTGKAGQIQIFLQTQLL
jgi:hypothetical protein